MINPKPDAAAVAEAEQLALELEPLQAEDILHWAAERFGEQFCLTCSWQRQSSVLVHMLSELGLRIDVIELDTELFFRETYETRARLVERYDLNVVRPGIISVAEQHLQEGPNLWERDPDRCCHIRKVEPLSRALKGLAGWVTGMRREQSVTRSDLKAIERDELNGGIFKINPLLGWSEEQLVSYTETNHLPKNRLYSQGYRSIGCAPCTRSVKPGEDARAGRWWWENPENKECGLHRR